MQELLKHVSTCIELSIEFQGVFMLKDLEVLLPPAGKGINHQKILKFFWNQGSWTLQVRLAKIEKRKYFIIQQSGYKNLV